MELSNAKLIVISHASIKQINRAVYRYLKREIKQVNLVVPVSLRLSSGTLILAEEPRPDDVPVLPMELKGQNPRTYFYPSLIEYLNLNQPDVILLENDPVSKLGFQLSKWCRQNNAKLICQTYENLKRNFLFTVKTQGWKALGKNLLISALNFHAAKRVNALLVVNAESERIFKNYGYSQVCKIVLGYDNKVFFSDLESKYIYRNKLGITANTTLIAYFGRLVPQKGVHLLIEGLAKLKSLSWKLLLDHIHDSSNEYITIIRDLIKFHSLEGHVIYFEADHFEIANYMRAADIMVAPSVTTPFFKEQYGRAVQEAMACGCVTLVSDSGHLQDLVDEPDLVFKEGNVDQLSAMLDKFISDGALLMRFSEILKNRAALKLTTEYQASQLKELIRNIDIHNE